MLRLRAWRSSADLRLELSPSRRRRAWRRHALVAESGHIAEAVERGKEGEYERWRDACTPGMIILQHVLMKLALLNFSPPQAREARLDALPVVKRGAGVDVEGHLLGVVRVGFSSVEVDHVADLSSAAVNDPVVTVEWRCVAVR